MRPSNRVTIRCARRAESAERVTIRIVAPRSFSSLSKLNTSSPALLSRLPVGSSAKINFGSPTSAGVTATRCCAPITHTTQARHLCKNVNAHYWPKSPLSLVAPEREFSDNMDRTLSLSVMNESNETDCIFRRQLCVCENSSARMSPLMIYFVPNELLWHGDCGAARRNDKGTAAVVDTNIVDGDLRQRNCLRRRK